MRSVSMCYVPKFIMSSLLKRKPLARAQVRMRTARLMGVNLGHRAVGSNAWHFMQRMGVNAARLFLYTTIPCVQDGRTIPCQLLLLHATFT